MLRTDVRGESRVRSSSDGVTGSHLAWDTNALNRARDSNPAMFSGAESVRETTRGRSSVWHPARIGGVLWIGAAVQFVIAMVVVQLAWTHPYDLLQNAISDLGAVTCHENPMGTSYVCSPLHAVFNASIIGFGILIALGALATRSAFPRGRVASAASATLVLSGVGAALVGVFPEDVYGLGHGIGALLAFVGSSVALLLFGVAMVRRPEWNHYPLLSFVCGAISGATIIASNVSENWGPIGFGGLERIILAPALVWLLLVGTHLVRFEPQTDSSGRRADPR